MKNRSIKIIVIIQVSLIVISFLLGGLFMLILVGINPLIKNNNYNIIKDNTKVYEKNSLAKSIEKVYDSVVAVETYDVGILANTGTGFVYKVDKNYGYILTNEHILEDSDTVKVVFSNEEEVTAEILGKDEYLDLAVLKVAKKYVTMIATIGNSNNLNLGDTIFAIGSPLGTSYRGSVTAGIVSGKNRLVTTSTSKENDGNWVMSVLQIDAAINPGNSGGPLVNINGAVVGVCTMKLVDDKIEGMAFAIPIEYAMKNIDSLEKGEKIKWPKLGITMKNVDDSNLNLNNITLPNNKKEGVIITEVKKDTASAKANLEENDVIIKINDIKTKNVAYLRYALYQFKPGEVINITYIRDGKEHKTKVILD